MRNMRAFRGAALVGGALLVAGCGDLLKVTNPGPIEDKNLDSPSAVPGLVTGMSADLSSALGDIVYATSIMADELAHGGSYTQEGLWYRGIIRPEDINGYWATMQRARWVAEQGIERMKAIEGYDYATDPLSTRANIYAGYANRLLGENVCQAVIDGGAAQEHEVHFQRAESYFKEAITLAADQEESDLETAARAGLASVLAWQDKWDDAATEAALVPTDFRFDAIFSINSGRENNYLVVESNTSCTGCRRELTVYNTPWADRDRNDPRVPWTIPLSSGQPMKGQDGKTLFYQQMKYADLGADIPLAKGTEMLLLRAEAELRKLAPDLSIAMGLINDQRAHYSLAALPTPTTAAEVWAILQVERGAVVWLEARRFWDLRRWNAEALIGNWKSTESGDHDKCIPISYNEQNSNLNLRG